MVTIVWDIARTPYHDIDMPASLRRLEQLTDAAVRAAGGDPSHLTITLSIEPVAHHALADSGHGLRAARVVWHGGEWVVRHSDESERR